MNSDKMIVSVSDTGGFAGFIRANWSVFVLILIAGACVRCFLLVSAGESLISGDAKLRYLPTAVNILNGNGFSIDTAAPFRPSEAAVPVYPLFIAAVYFCFGSNPIAIGIVQIIIDLGTGFILAFISWQLAAFRYRRAASLAAFFIYIVVSWFTMVWSARVLTETLAIFFTVAAIAFCADTLATGRHSWKSWTGAGVCSGLALLTRPDSALLVAAVGSVLLIHFLKNLDRTAFAAGVLYAAAVLATLSPWIIRNYLVFDKFQPLASEWGFASGDFMPVGYLHWVKTWITDETYFDDVFNQPFIPGLVRFETSKLPDSIFDGNDEHLQVEALMQRYNETLLFDSEIDAEFQTIADKRIARDPLRYYVGLPVTRTASVWLTGFATNHATPWMLIARLLSVAPIIIGGLIGFALTIRRSILAQLLFSIVVVRTLFLAYHYAPETRYIVEAYPPMIAAASIAFAFLLVHLERRFSFRSRLFSPPPFSKPSR